MIHPVTTLPIYFRVFRRIDLATMDYLRTLWPATSGVLAMTAAVLAVRLVMPPHWFPSARLALQIAVGGSVYLLTMATLHRRCLHALVDLVRTVRR
jgi:hypothetical protein